MYRTLILFLTLSIIGGTKHFVPLYTISLKNEPSEIGPKEDPGARANYELRMLADPATGHIPRHIRQKELKYTRKIPSKRSLSPSNGKMSARDYLAGGPFNVGGRTRAVAFDIRNEKIILAGGVSGGIWKSQDEGFTWVKTSDPLNGSSVTCLAQDIRRGKEKTWYYGTGELIGNSAKTLAAAFRGAGLYKSTDAGETWESITPYENTPPQLFNSPFQYIWRIETNHTNVNQDEVLVAAFGSILRSLDGGLNWQVELGEQLLDVDKGTDLNCSVAPFFTDLKKTGDGHFFAALSSVTASLRSTSCELKNIAQTAGFFFSENGDDWVEITPPTLPDYHERTVIGLSAEDRYAYFFTLQSSVDKNEFTLLNRFDLSLYSTGAPQEQCWTDLSAHLPSLGGEFGNLNVQGGYNMVIGGHPDKVNTVFIGGTNLYRSSSGFTTSNAAKWIGGYHPNNTGAVYDNHYPDQHFLLFYPSNGSVMLSANDGGLRKTSNNLADSVSWSSLNRGFITSQFYTISQQQDEASDAIIGGMQDNGTYLRDGVDVESPYWTRILGGDGGYTAILPSQNLYYISFQKGQTYRLLLNDNNEITSFGRVDPYGAGSSTELLFINPFLLDPENPNRMYYTGGNVIWRNDNLLQIPAGSQKPTGINWDDIPGTFTSAGLYTSISKSHHGDTLLAGTFQRQPQIVQVRNASKILPDVRFLSSSLFPQNGHIACIAIHPENANHFLVVFSNYSIPSLFLTTDGGENFTDISGNLEEFPDGTGSGPSARWAEIIPTTSGLEYFVGTSTGLYSTSAIDGQNTAWLKESEDLIGNAIITMMNFRSIDGRLVIASHGNGTFRTFIEEAIQPTSNPGPTPGLKLSQNFPNPFSTTTHIEFTIPENNEVMVDLYDSQGKLVRNLLHGPQFAGTSRITWNGTNTAGNPVKPGVYNYVLRYKNTVVSKRALFTP